MLYKSQLFNKTLIHDMYPVRILGPLTFSAAFLSSSNEKIDNYLAILNDDCNEIEPSSPENLKCGGQYIARISTDPNSKWHRVKVHSLCYDASLVLCLFLDYGFFSDVCSDEIKIPPENHCFFDENDGFPVFLERPHTIICTINVDLKSHYPLSRTMSRKVLFGLKELHSCAIKVRFSDYIAESDCYIVDLLHNSGVKSRVQTMISAFESNSFDRELDQFFSFRDELDNSDDTETFVRNATVRITSQDYVTD